jgi:hypothetical protein
MSVNNNKTPRSVVLRHPTMMTPPHYQESITLSQHQQRPQQGSHQNLTPAITIQWNIIIVACFLICAGVCGILILCVYWINAININYHRDMIDHDNYHLELGGTPYKDSATIDDNKFEKDRIKKIKSLPEKYTHPPLPPNTANRRPLHVNLIKKEEEDPLKPKVNGYVVQEKQTLKKNVDDTALPSETVSHVTPPSKEEDHKNIILKLDTDQLKESSVNIPTASESNGWIYKETLTSILQNEEYTSSTMMGDVTPPDSKRTEYVKKMAMSNSFDPFFDLSSRTKKVVSQFIRKNANEAACCCLWQWMPSEEMGLLDFESCAPLNRDFLGFTKLIGSTVSHGVYRILEDLSFECYLSEDKIHINFGFITLIKPASLRLGQQKATEGSDFYGYISKQQQQMNTNTANKNDTIKEIQVTECFIDLLSNNRRPKTRETDGGSFDNNNYLSRSN